MIKAQCKFPAGASLRVIGLTVGLQFVASPAHAVAALEEVIVTAQKREQRLMDVPVAVSAVGRDAIENNEINNIDDLSKLIPSLRFTSDAYTNSAVNVRGIGTNVYSIAVEPNVSVMLDGVVLARSSMASFDFTDIERVEVLRGPQGTLFGKNASAGLVHVITRDPAEEFEGRARLSYEWADNTPGDLAKFQGTVSGPLFSALSGRLSLFTKKADGHLENIHTGQMAPEHDEYGARIKLVWDSDSALRARVNLEMHDKEGTSGLITYRDGNPSLRERSAPIEFSEDNRQARAFDDNLANSEGRAASLTLDYDWGALMLTSVTGFRSAHNQDNITVYGLDGQRGHLRRNFTDIEIETFTQEFRVSSTDSDRLEFTGGVLWFDNNVVEDYDRNIEDLSVAIVAGTVQPGLVPLSLGQGLGGNDAVNQDDTRDAEVDVTNIGVFSEVTWHMTDRWHLTAGARYLDEQVDIALAKTSELSHPTGIPAQSSEFPRTSASIKDTAVTGKLAVMYDWQENVNIYATVATGYRGGAFDVASDDTQSALDNPVEAEKATSLELGVKSRLFENRLELNATLFHTVFEDFQAQIRDLQNTGSLVAHRLDNAGELETKGVEIEFQAKPIESLLISGALLYNRAVYNDFITQCFAGQRADERGAIDSDGDGVCDAQDVSGGVLANAPERSASLVTRYDHGFENGHVLYAQLSGRWQDEVQFTNEQQPTTIEDAYAIWDLRVGLQGPGHRYEVAGYIKNLAATTYTKNLTPLTVSSDRRDVVHHLPLDADRVFGVSLSYSW